MTQLEKNRKLIAFDKCLVSSKTLINRLLKEYDHYMRDGPDVEAENAMLANPLLYTIGTSLFQKLGVYLAVDIARLGQQYVTDMVSRFSKKKQQSFDGPSAPSGSTAASTNDTGDADADDDEDSDAGEIGDLLGSTSLFGQVERDREIVQRALIQNSRGNTTGNTENVATQNNNEAEIQTQQNFFRRCEEELAGYKRYCEREVHPNWEAVIKKFPTDKYKMESEKWTEREKRLFSFRCGQKDFPTVGKYFDCLQWWQLNKGTFHRMFPTAMLWLSKPSTNAFAERVFSMASWFASNRRMNRQGSKVFEMRTLDCINRKVLESIWVAEQELVEQEIVEGKTVLTVSDEHGRESVNNQDVLLLSEQSCQGDVRRYHQMINGLRDHMDYNDKASESLVVEDDDGPQKFSYIGDDGKTYEADSIDIVNITRDDVPEASKGEVEGNGEGEGEGEVPTENQAPATQALTSTVTDQHQMNESDDESDGDLGDADLLEYLKERKDEVEHEGDMTVVSLSTVQTKGQDTARSSAGGKTSLDSSSKKRAASKTPSVSSDKGGTAKKQKRSVAGKKPSPEERLRAKKKDGNKDGKKRATVTSLPLRRNTRTPSPNRQGSKGKKAVRRSPRKKKRKQQSKSREQKAIVYEVEDTEEEDNEEEEEEEEGSYSDDDDEDGNDETED